MCLKKFEKMNITVAYILNDSNPHYFVTVTLDGDMQCFACHRFDKFRKLNDLISATLCNLNNVDVKHFPETKRSNWFKRSENEIKFRQSGLQEVY